MPGVDHSEQGSSEVHEQQLHARRIVLGHQIAAQGAQRGGLATTGIAEDHQIGLRIEIDHHRREFVFTEAEQRLRGGPVARHRAYVVHLNSVRQQPNGGRMVSSVLGLQNAADAGQRCTDPRIGGIPVQTGQRQQQLMPVLGEPPAGCAAAQLAGSLAVHLGLGRIAEPQFDACAQLILERGAEVGPARRSHHHVEAERKPLHGKRGDRRLQRVVLCAQSRPSVDDQENITPRIIDVSVITACPVFGHGADTESGEPLLTNPDQGLQLSDGAPDQVRIGPPGNRADVRQYL